MTIPELERLMAAAEAESPGWTVRLDPYGMPSEGTHPGRITPLEVKK
jgi:hypothetical protein